MWVKEKPASTMTPDPACMGQGADSVNGKAGPEVQSSPVVALPPVLTWFAATLGKRLAALRMENTGAGAA